MNEHLLSRYRSIVDHPDLLWNIAHHPLPICIWVNRHKSSNEVLRDVLRSHDVRLDSVDWWPGTFRTQSWTKPGETIPYRLGWYLIQEEIAMTAVYALDPQSGDTVLDMCAAPGNKTVQIAARLHPSGFVVANEWNRGRLSSLWSSIARMGMTNIATVHSDGRSLPLPNHYFDRVLVDVPCSGEGTLRKHLQRDWSTAQTMKAIARLVPIQKQLLSRALDLVTPGGVVVYSTCTFAPEENEAVLDAVLGNRAVVEPFDIPGLTHCPGLRTWQAQSFRDDVIHAHRYYPHLNDTGGFFVARLRRTEAPARTVGVPDTKTQNHFQSVRHKNLNQSWGDRPDDLPLSQFCERFGISPSVFDSLDVWAKSRDKLCLVDKSYGAVAQALASVDVQNLGLVLFRMVQRHKKPTTSILQRFGATITQNVVVLKTPEQLQTFLLGNPQTLPPDRTTDLDEGYVHVRYQVYELGCGLWVNKMLHSQIPKSLRLRPMHN